MKKTNTHGGKRSKAGRKPVADPKKQLSIYILQSQITAVGGDEAAKKIATDAIEKASIGETGFLKGSINEETAYYAAR